MVVEDKHREYRSWSEQKNCRFTQEGFKSIIGNVIGKGTIFDFEVVNTYMVPGNEIKVKIRVTSMSLKPWGSIHLNLRLDGGDVVGFKRYFISDDTNRDKEFSIQLLKRGTLTSMILYEIKPYGFKCSNIFINRLYL